MTDSNLVKNELVTIMGITQEDASAYDSLIDYTVSTVSQIIKDEKDENDIRIVYLCAVKAYYFLTLIQSDGISSFSAGEVSFSLDASAHSRAKALLNEAVLACSELISRNEFAFKAV